VRFEALEKFPDSLEPVGVAVLLLPLEGGLRKGRLAANL
jgi:hypothetical protein